MPLSSLADRADEYEPMLPKSYGALTLSTTSSTAARAGPTYYGGFSQQKRVWASTARRSRRLRVLATTQLVLGTLSLFNYLWCVAICSKSSSEADCEWIQTDDCQQDLQQLHGRRGGRRARRRAVRGDQLGRCGA